MLMRLAIWCVSGSVEIGRTVGRVLRWVREVAQAPEFVDINDKDRRQRLFGGWDE